MNAAKSSPALSWTIALCAASLSLTSGSSTSLPNSPASLSTIARDVPAGEPREYLEPGVARFLDRRHVRLRRQPLRRRGREHLEPARLHLLHHLDRRREHQLRLAADEIGDRRPAALVGNMRHLDAGAQLEQFAGQMGNRAIAGRGERQRSWLRLRQRDQFGDGFRIEVRMRDEDERRHGEQRDRGERLVRIVRKLRIHHLGNHERRRREQ